MTQNKYFNKIIALIIFLIATLSLASCGSNEKNVGNIICDNMISHFYYPESVSVTEAELWGGEKKVAVVRISGKTKGGSRTTSDYRIVLKDFTYNSETTSYSFKKGAYYSSDSTATDNTNLSYYMHSRLVYASKELNVEKINKVLTKWKKNNSYM